jgi:hypothetical protein
LAKNATRLRISWIGSSAGDVGWLQLLAAPVPTRAELRSANAMFSEWVAALAIPLRAEPRRLEISWHDSGFFLIESPEPLGRDVTVRLFENSAERQTLTLVDETASRMLLVCDTSAAGDIRLEFRLDRTCYRAVLAGIRAVSRRRRRSPSTSTETPTRCSGRPRRDSLLTAWHAAGISVSQAICKTDDGLSGSPRLAGRHAGILQNRQDCRVMMQRQEAALNRDVLVP